MFIFLITACSPELPTPAIESIAPEVVVAEQVTTVTVFGKNFHPYLHLVNSEEIEQIADVGIYLSGDSEDRIEMNKPTIIDAETLQFETTSELLSGSYLVEAEWEDGREVTSRRLSSGESNAIGKCDLVYA